MHIYASLVAQKVQLGMQFREAWFRIANRPRADFVKSVAEPMTVRNFARTLSVVCVHWSTCTQCISEACVRNLRSP
eukprot:6632088-Alexandrium_andersonii.AAC.1